MFTFIVIVLHLLFRENALSILISLATGILPKNENLKLTEDATIVFDNVTESVLAKKEQFICCDIKYNYLPQFIIEWITCHAWFLYLTRNVQISISMLRTVIEKIQNIIKVNNYEENQ